MGCNSGSSSYIRNPGGYESQGFAEEGCTEDVVALGKGEPSAAQAQN